MGILQAKRHFNEDIAGRNLMIFTDHLPIIGSFNSSHLQAHDPQALKAINEIRQFTSDIRHKDGKDCVVPDHLSRPSNVSPFNVMGKSYQEIQELSSVQYIPPEKTLAALEEVALHTMNPEHLALEQNQCPEVQSHKAGNIPKSVEMGIVKVAGSDLFCEVSDPNSPRPMVPRSLRNLVCNLFHHGDHPGQKESLIRIAKEYYWPKMRKEIDMVVRSCHPCQIAKQSRTVNPGVGSFSVPDKRFEYIHLDIVGPLPESRGHKFLLTIYNRCSRWLEAFPLVQGSSGEVCQAFVQHVSRFGLCKVSVSDNGNAFIANLFKDMCKTFNIQINFCPAYHPQTNGAIERRHQDIKKNLKSSLVEMDGCVALGTVGTQGQISA